MTSYAESIIRLGSYRINFDRLYFYSFFLFYVLSFIFHDVYFVKVLPLIIGTTLYWAFLFFAGFRLNLKSINIAFFILFFSLMAVLYIFLESGVSGLLSVESFYFISLILIFIAACRLVAHKDIFFLSKFFFSFLFFQLFLMLGQLMKMLTGVGFHVPANYIESAGDAYSVMLSGTFVNVNDLASVAVMIGLFFMMSKNLSERFYRSAMVIVFVIAFLTTSRSSLIFFLGMLLFFEVRRSIGKAVLTFLGLGFLFYLLYVFGDNAGGQIDAVDRVIVRLNTLSSIASDGLQRDNSISLRLDSYLHFLSNLSTLGFGSGRLRDYSDFVSDLGPRFSLFEVNPHSFIVEVGYWLGWPGLLVLILLLTSCLSLRNCMNSVFLISAFLVLSSVSSSIINNFFFMIAFFCCLALSVSSSCSLGVSKKRLATDDFDGGRL